ncbi:hypothetical protein RRF57_000094 [Xylaria bambusicola]|uniref:Uncharacterized protein n=1 Tax=Xylaria bambusicola TaxID=326684 RepID=A0AAN7UA62_9PEZI
MHEFVEVAHEDCVKVSEMLRGMCCTIGTSSCDKGCPTVESIVKAIKEAVGIGAANLVYSKIGFTILPSLATSNIFVVDQPGEQLASIAYSSILVC